MSSSHHRDPVEVCVTPYPVILVSASPRRREFMQQLGLPFEVRVADVDEQDRDGEPPQALVARLSQEKALAVAARFPQAVVIGADTIVTLGGELLGKPADPQDAADMLRRLRDRPHQVYSGVTVCPSCGSDRRGEALTGVVGSTVWMRPYTEDEIAAYVASGDPLDKAGAYGIQNAEFHPVARMRGCYASVMGLPLCALDDLLRQAGVVPPVDVAAACQAHTGVPCCGGGEGTLSFEA
jgi:septum formation protein